MPLKDFNETKTDPMVEALNRLRVRLGLFKGITLAVMGIAIAATASCVWLIGSRFFPILGNPLPVTLALLGLGLIVALIIAFRLRPSLLDVALEVDQRLNLRERLTSSLELSGNDSPMVMALHSDARRRIEGIDIPEHFRFKPTAAMRWAAAPLLCFGFLYTWLPEYDLTHYRERMEQAQLEEQAKKARVEKLKSIARVLKSPEAKKTNISAEFAEKINVIAEELQNNAITEKQALARLSNVSDEMRKRAEEMANQNPLPGVMGDTSKLKFTRDIADNLKKDNVGEAAKKIEDLRKKLESGQLTQADMKAIGQELSDLAKMMQTNNSELNDALAKAMANAGESLKADDLQKALEALKNSQLSMEDMQSLMQQLQQMQASMEQMSQWKQDALGPSGNCRQCGKKLKQCKGGKGCKKCGPGHSCYGACAQCAAGKGKRVGVGMGGEGRGAGNSVGDLPDAQVQYKPTVLPGPITKGKALASILQKTAPDAGAQPTAEFISGAFTRVEQENEQALMKEEIPPGSKEFVRQYFMSLEPDNPNNH